MKGWVGLVSRPTADGLPTEVVTRQLQVKRAAQETLPRKDRRSSNVLRDQRKTQNSGQHAVQGHSRSPILVAFESSYANSYNTILHPILYRFQVIADYWSHFCSWREVSLFNTLIRGWTHKTEDYEIWPQATRNITLSHYWDAVDILNRIGMEHEYDREMDRQTDRQTDRTPLAIADTDTV